MARQSVQLIPAPKATFFGDFPFLPEKKVTPAGQALTPQTREEPTKAPKTENAVIKSEASVVTFFSIEKHFYHLLASVYSYLFHSK